MLKSLWFTYGDTAQNLGVSKEAIRTFSTQQIFKFTAVEKVGGFSVLSTRVFRAVSHINFRHFTSVLGGVLLGFHKTYGNNNKLLNKSLHIINWS